MSFEKVLEGGDVNLLQQMSSINALCYLIGHALTESILKDNALMKLAYSFY